ncbi:MAG: hypothetical protein Ta2B_14250 [Termitinemataceae bacterium]|nr:MAG: hypothetical protein Ta2B_14250 [Termitinemataceae bacterium]
MNNANREIYLVQNPAIGSAIIWRFICGYNSKNSKPVPFPLLFLVLPIIFRKDLCDVICHTNKTSGLMKVSEKLFSDKNNDKIFTVHNTAEQYKELSMISIRIGLNSKLFHVNTQTALVLPLTISSKKGLEKSTQQLLSAAEKLGYWCADLTLHEISMLLKVRF